jgi:hypothetical protein
MPAKKKTTKKKATKTDGSTKLTNPNHEVFARLYGGANSEYFGNGKRSYLLAYGYLERLDNLDNQKTEAKPGSEEYKEARRAINSIYSTAEVNASKLLGNTKVAKRINYLMDQALDELEMDRELAFVARQRKDLSSKVRAIAEYNKVRERTKGNITGELVVRWEE